ncbi:MAG: insulinase family protein, partial [Bacteroidales bacterium]|nr:insulinase family protein [Bacteroidales bacterium]
RKVINKVFQTLFPHHPYGLQTVLGTQQQLKNPSITNIKKYFKNWYVSNNIAICLSGDFDPDTMINVIHKYFGAMKPNQDIKRLKIVPETPITKPVKKIVYGPMAENITIAWRFPAMNNPAADTLELISKVLTNGRAGLMDLNVNQAQKVLESYTYYYPMADYSMLIMQGMPKSGQTLDQVKSIMLNEINKLKSGDFSDTLLTSIINNEKRYDMSQLQDNGYRANMYVDAFVNDIPWKKEYKKSERMEKLSREDIIKFAKKYLDSNYVEVKKLQGEDTSVHKIDKPHITPILTNRDTASLFLKNIKNSKVNPIEPVFADFEKDLKIIVLKNGDTLLYKKNTHNSLFDMSFIYDFGRSSDKTLPFASTYSDYLGTSAYTAKQLSSMFYEMAVDRYINIGNYQTSINLYGLQEYQDKALDLLEESINDMQPDEKALESVKSDIFKSRSNAKTSQRSCFYALLDYIIYGPKNPQTYTLSNKEISGLKSGELISELKKLGQYKCKVVYYGPEDVESVAKRLNEDEFLSATKTPCPVSDHFSMPETKKSILYLAPYKANNIYYVALTNEGRRFDPKAEPSVEMFNGYFGGGMGSIVFQDIREARGLAYSAGAYYDSPSYTDMPYCFYTYIITQNDKLMDASRAMTGIVEDMPIASKTFEIAKKNIMDRLRTDRIKDEDLPGYYLRMKRLGLNYDSRRDLFEKLPALTLDDISGFQKKYIKGKTFSYAILGNEKDLKIGEFAKENKCIVERLSLEDIFGY